MNLLEEEFSISASPLVELVLRAQAVDREALGQLMVRYEGAVYAIALRRLSNHAEAQELSQEVFVQAMEKIDQLRQPECFGGWIRSIAKRMAINRAVRRSPLLSSQPDELESCTEERTPLGNVLASEERSRVRAGLKRLRKLDRQTLEAFYVQGRSLAEMSNTFESPVGTIKRRLHVARKRRARELAELAPAYGSSRLHRVGRLSRAVGTAQESRPTCSFPDAGQR
jgi:RNA polymerase sigma-70 factor, ECF subfamily